jgi:putative thiamine transport system ATP-binding protein
MSLTISHLSIYESNNTKIPGKALIKELSVEVDNGAVLTLMGPSGSGKSTLLSVIAGFVSCDFAFTGEVLLQDKAMMEVKPENRKIGILFQDDLLFPHLSICENLMIALPNSIKGKKRKEIALATLDEINLLALADKSSQQISGGQKARISVMRLLLAEPQAVLLDEPFSKLDKSLRSDFRNWLFIELRKRNLPTILVTHDQEDSPKDAKILNWPWIEVNS